MGEPNYCTGCTFRMAQKLGEPEGWIRSFHGLHLGPGPYFGHPCLTSFEVGGIPWFHPCKTGQETSALLLSAAGLLWKRGTVFLCPIFNLHPPFPEHLADILAVTLSSVEPVRFRAKRPLCPLGVDPSRLRINSKRRPCVKGAVNLQGFLFSFTKLGAALQLRTDAGF